MLLLGEARGADTPNRVAAGAEKSFPTLAIAAASGDEDGLTELRVGMEKKDAFSGFGPIRSASAQFTTAARTPNALVGMWRTRTFIKSDKNPAKIAISGRNTPSSTMIVDTPLSAALPYEAAVSIITGEEQNGFVRPLNSEGGGGGSEEQYKTTTARMFKYQDEAVEWMKGREFAGKGGMLCHEMGLGKTRMMCRLMRENMLPLTLVLTTKSTVGGWLAELREQSKFAFDVREYKKDKTYINPERNTVLVSTHHSILKKNAEWFAARRFDRIVVDEIHVLRNPGVLQTGVSNIPSALRWGLTATPFNNSARDISSYMRFLCEGAATAEDRSKFGEWVMRKTREEVFEDDCPKIVPKKFVYEFESLEERMMYEYVAGRIDEANAWIELNARRLPRHVRGQMMLLLQLRERQAAIHPQIVLDAEKVWRMQMPELLGNPEDLRTWDESKVTKFRYIMEMVRADQAKKRSTMIVTHFETELQLIKARLESGGITPLVINGKTKAKERTAMQTINSDAPILEMCRRAVYRRMPDAVMNIVESFLVKPRVLLLQIVAGGVGLSLPWVDHVIHTSPDWNPFLEKQASYRALRATSTHDVRVTSMYFSRTIDTRIQERQASKFEQSLEWTGDAPKTIAEYISMPV
jgi:SNF2 family DNA or RNA helicase